MESPWAMRMATITKRYVTIRSCRYWLKARLIPTIPSLLLRRTGLVEGRKPNLYVSASVASASATKADYIRTRAQDDEFYKKLVTDYIEEFGAIGRKDIEELLLSKLSDALSEEQKLDKISNLLSSMRRAGIIRNDGTRKASSWVFAGKNAG